MQSPKKKAKAEEDSIIRGRRKKSCFDGMSLREQWSAVENVILVENDLQNVSVMEEDSIWDNLDSIAEDESLERKAGKEPQGGDGWPQTTAKSI